MRSIVRCDPGEGVQVSRLSQLAETAPHPDPLRASFARLDPAKERGEGEDAAAQSFHYTTGERPPSTLMAVPVMNDPCSEARKQARLANSSAVPIRPSGTPLARSRVKLSKSLSGALWACRLTH